MVRVTVKPGPVVGIGTGCCGSDIYNDNVYTGDYELGTNNHAGYNFKFIMVDDEPAPPGPGFGKEVFEVREDAGSVNVHVTLTAAKNVATTIAVKSYANTACGRDQHVDRDTDDNDVRQFTPRVDDQGDPVICHVSENPDPGDVDYQKVDATVTIPAGSTGVAIPITITDDNKAEAVGAYEAFWLRIESVDGVDVTADDLLAEVRIVEDDRNISFEIGSYLIPEQDGSKTLKLTASARDDKDQVIDLTAIDLGTDGSEYSIPSQVTLPAGETSVEFDVVVYYGRTVGHELFRIVLGEGTYTHGQSPSVTDVIIAEQTSGLATCSLPVEVSEEEQGLQEGVCGIPAGTNVIDVAEHTIWGVTYTVKGDTPAACSDTTHTTEATCTGAGATWTPAKDGRLIWSGYVEDDNKVSHRVVRTRNEIGSDAYENDLLKIVNDDMNLVYVDVLGWHSGKPRVRFRSGRETHARPVRRCHTNGVPCTGFTSIGLVISTELNNVGQHPDEPSGFPNTPTLLESVCSSGMASHDTEKKCLNAGHAWIRNGGEIRGVYDSVEVPIARFTNKTCDLYPNVEFRLGKVGRWDENGSRATTSPLPDPSFYRERVHPIGETGIIHPMREYIKLSYMDPSSTARWNNSVIRLCD